MAAFEYHRPTSLDEALGLLAGLGPDAKVLAGGQSLVPIMAMRLAAPSHLVDIGRVPGLGAVTVTESGAVEIGALVRQAEAERSPTIADRAPLVAKALPWIGHRAIRNRGTVCGSVAHADPAAELPATMLALDATLVLQSVRGTREVAAADFFTGFLATAGVDDEILTAVRLPTVVPRWGSAVVEIARRHGDFALVGVTCALRLDDAGTIEAAAVSLFGVAATPVRVATAEALLRGQRPTTALFADAAAVVSRAIDPPGDGHATAAYRRHVAGVLTRRGLAAALFDSGAVEVAA
jgi:aerobic carbon-monoxide dehydrogenase medium subunit